MSPLPSPDHSSSLGDPLSDDTQHTGRPLVQAARKPATSPQGDRHTDLSHGSTSPIKRLSSQRTRLDQRRRWREGFSPNMDLPELFEHMTPQCRRFFTLLDRELERVTGFYADREEEAVRRFQQLRAQWDELASTLSDIPLSLRVVLITFLQTTRRSFKLSASASCTRPPSSPPSSPNAPMYRTFPARTSSAAPSHNAQRQSRTKTTWSPTKRGESACRSM